MKEILFRAKHIHALLKNEYLDGTWVYGYLCNENYIHSPELGGEHLIDKNTISQYTGLRDKNGDRIFEGDIVRYTDELIGKEKNDEIKYSEKYASFCRLHKSKMGLQYLYLYKDIALDCEVIGNIFDNPELLEVAE